MSEACLSLSGQLIKGHLGCGHGNHRNCELVGYMEHLETTAIHLELLH